MGSHADQTVTATSDLDLVFALDDAFVETDETRALAEALAEDGVEVWGEREGVFTADEKADEPPSVTIHKVTLKLGATHLQGVDFRSQIPLPSASMYGAALWCVADGWRRRFEAKPDDLRLFAHSALSVAAARAFEASQEYLFRKRDFAPAYEKHVGDAWTPFFNDVHRLVWKQWGHRWPEAPSERARLHRLLEWGQELGQVIRTTRIP